MIYRWHTVTAIRHRFHQGTYQTNHTATSVKTRSNYLSILLFVLFLLLYISDLSDGTQWHVRYPSAA